MAKKQKPITDDIMSPNGPEKPKFSLLVAYCKLECKCGLTCRRFLSSYIVTITVARSRTFYLHSDLLLAESERCAKNLQGNFKEAESRTIEIEDEDPELFGFFVGYLYRDQSMLSRNVQHHSEYIILARLYAMGERLMAPCFQSYCLWRFTESLGTHSSISDEGICELLQLACTEITERVREDPLRSQIFWYGGSRIATLQQYSMFRQLLYDLPDLGRQLCLWVYKSQPLTAPKPAELLCQRFGPESEHVLGKIATITLGVDEESPE